MARRRFLVRDIAEILEHWQENLRHIKESWCLPCYRS